VSETARTGPSLLKNQAPKQLYASVDFTTVLHI
jgi:hypothetical protein